MQCSVYAPPLVVTCLLSPVQRSPGKGQATDRCTQVYRTFIEAVDAVDNGVMQFALPPGTAPLYLNNTTLGARVGSLNPRWNQPSDEETLYKQVRGWGGGPAPRGAAAASQCA